MWSADYVQIPENTSLSTEEKESETQPDQSHASSTLAPVENPVENKAAEIVRRMSLAGSKDIGELMQRSTLVATEHESRFTKSASGSSLSEEDREGTQPDSFIIDFIAHSLSCIICYEICNHIYCVTFTTIFQKFYYLSNISCTCRKY